MTYKLLVVDDELANLRLLARLFSRDFECLTASSGAEAIGILEQHDIAILITDQRMPQMTGIDLLRHTARLRPHMVRILLTGYTDVEVLVDAINSGLVYMYVTKPWNNEDLKLKISRACEHYESNRKASSLTLANERLVARLQENKLTVVKSLAEMVKTRDSFANSHALRVRQCALSIAQKMGLTGVDMEDLAAAAMVHGLSEIDTFDLVRAGAVTTKKSFTEAQAECEAKLMEAIPELANVAEVVRFHHENFDGSGSPTGLRDDQIPVLCRILRVADEYDLMIAPKPPAAALKHDEAMRFLSQRSGKQFDPSVVEIMSLLSEPELPQSAAVDQPHSQTHERDLVLLDPVLA
ncbi:MAG TPA: HD domain-containing phosphohydrolase [Pyrinomonadaceae bacterium]|nr:HD domain-containing phosphohydrolase [Pyrinomonadaceae bacterium]